MTWIKRDDKQYELVESDTIEHGKYIIYLRRYKSNIKCLIYIKVIIKYNTIPVNQVIGHVEAVLIQRRCRFQFYNCCFQYSKSLARLSYDLFHQNGTLRACKWTKLSNDNRYEANFGYVLYFRKIFIEPNHRGNDLGFVVCKHILCQIQNLFSISVVKPEYKNPEHKYQRNLVRQIFWRLGYRPLEDGGNYPYKDYWFLVPDDLDSERKDVECSWNLPVLLKTNESLDNLLSNLQNYRDEKAVVKKIKSYLKSPKRKMSMTDALHHAAKHNMDRIVTCLLSSQQVDINCQDEYGNTILHICSLSMYRQLLKYPNIDIHVKNKAGKLPYDIAVESFSALRCHNKMQSVKPDYSIYERFYFILLELMPPVVYNSLLESLISPTMAGIIVSVISCGVIDGICDCLQEMHSDGNVKRKASKVFEDQFFDRYFPVCVLNRKVSTEYVAGFLQILDSVNHLLDKEKILPTRSRILKHCKQSGKKFYADFFNQGGKYDHVVEFMINLTDGESIYHGDEFEFIDEVESKMLELKQVPYFDDDIEYLRCIISKYLLKN